MRSCHFKIFKKPTEPGGVAVLIRPEQDVGVLSLEGRSAQLQVGVDTMEERWQTQGRAHRSLPGDISGRPFFAHFDIGDEGGDVPQDI